MHGDAALFDALLAAADRAHGSPEEHYRYLYALGDFRDPALIDRGLQLRAVAAAAQPGHGAVPGTVLRAIRTARDRAWAFVKRALGRRSSRRSRSSAATPT